jgi:adenylate cyclase
VLSRNSTFQFKSGNVQPSVMKSDFGADYMVEGTVRQQNDQIRISARIIDTATGILLWSENYDGSMSDIFDIQDRLARKIAGSVATNVLSEEEIRRSAIPVPDMSAYDLVLRARSLGYSSNCRSNREYRQLLEKSIKRDPQYALPHAMMSEARVSQVVLGCAEFAETVQEDAGREARKAISLAPDQPDGYRALGRYLEIHSVREQANVDQARPVLARALQLNPSDSSALALWGTLELFNGNFAESVKSFENAKQLDSKMEPLYLFEFALAYYMSEQLTEALRLAEQSISGHPDFYLLRTVAAASAARLGKMETAYKHIEAIRPILPFVDYQGVADGFSDPDDADYWLDGLKMAGI